VVQPGAWSNSPSSYAYQWQRLLADGWDDIDSATGRTYKAAADDLGRRLRAEVVATNDDGSATAASTPTAPIGASGVQKAASATRCAKKAKKCVTAKASKHKKKHKKKKKKKARR